MTKYSSFIFESYFFDKSKKLLELHYSFDDKLSFKETYLFDFDFIDYDEKALQRAIELLFFMAGVSYYKAYPATEIIVKNGALDNKSAKFLSKTYQKGLGEFFYVNNLDPNTDIAFPSNTDRVTPIDLSAQKGLLIGVGGGKDSLVGIDLLRDKGVDLATWSVGHRPQLTPLVERIGLPHYWVERTWDGTLLELNSSDALNGHIPISAILACAGTVVAVLSGRRDVVVSNEQSANEPTLNYRGVDINHQYSKSQEFERDYQSILNNYYGGSLRYYSILRPVSELHIAKIFATRGFERYKHVFSSCNAAFLHSSNHIFWDGTCPKCAFVFLILTPFVAREDLESLFNSKNLLLDPNLEVTYKQLLGIEGDKPLECIGEVKESRAAMQLAQKRYPELSKYHFDIPSDYNYGALFSHSIPKGIYDLIAPALLNS